MWQTTSQRGAKWRVAHILDNDVPAARSGWSCPGCGRCYGPRVDECRHCPAPTFPEPSGPFSRTGSVSLEIPVTPAIFVPTRDVPGATPSRLADLQHVLNAATIPFDGMVDGKFYPLPPGSKILPAHPGPGWIRVPDEMTGPHYSRIVRVTTEWTEAWKGLQVRWNGAWEGEPAASIELRLTPAGNDPGPIEVGP